MQIIAIQSIWGEEYKQFSFKLNQPCVTNEDPIINFNNSIIRLVSRCRETKSLI